MKLDLRKKVALVLLPFVTVGLIYVYQKTKINDIYAVDPLVVTIDGVDATLNPMFTLTDMKPGDEIERCFNVKNTSPDTVAVEMTGFKTQEEKNFTEILDLEINDTSSSTLIFNDKLKDYFASPALNLGNFTSGSDRTYCVKVKFPWLAGNEYQLALVVFDLVWRTQLPDIVPPECRHLANQFADVIYGTEGNDYIHANIRSNLIFALAGNDIVDSSASDDCVVLGDGDDKVGSESGNDVVLGGAGKDEIKSGSDNDSVWGGSENDIIVLGSGTDLAYGEDGDDIIDGGNGPDTIYGGNGTDNIRGGSGNDKVYGEGGNDNIQGNTGDDFLDGGADTDIIRGDSGTDTCIAGETLFTCEL